MEFSHIPVLLDEVIEALAPERGGIYVDCTAGVGGHSSEIAKRLPEGSRLICLDRDDDAIAACSARLAPYAGKWEIVKTNFRNIGAALDMIGVDPRRCPLGSRRVIPSDRHHGTRFFLHR